MTVVLILTALIGVNAFYVAAEFAAVSVRLSRVQQQAEEGHGLARQLLPFVRDARELDRYIAACQIGITISSLVLGAYGQVALSRAIVPVFERMGQLHAASAEAAAAVVVLTGLTTIQMVFGELVPKSLALQHPARIALWTVVPMRWSLVVLSWFIMVLNGSGSLVLRALGFRSTGHRHVHSPEELELLVAESRDGGVLNPVEHRRLRKALRLGTRKVGQVMVPRIDVHAIEADLSPADAVAAVAASPYTRLPIYEDTIDNIIGFVHAGDVAEAAAGTGVISLRALARPVLHVPRGLTLDRFLVRLRESGQQTAVVLDEFGGTAGLVTVQDVISELVGDLADEFKDADPRPERLPDGRVRVPGHVAVDELEALVGASWPATDATTVGGSVVEAFARIPEPGERIVIDGIIVDVERVEHHAVTSVLITPPLMPA